MGVTRQLVVEEDCNSSMKSLLSSINPFLGYEDVEQAPCMPLPLQFCNSASPKFAWVTLMVAVQAVTVPAASVFGGFDSYHTNIVNESGSEWQEHSICQYGVHVFPM